MPRISSGNRTSGPHRKGNRRGRQPVYPPGTLAQTTAVRLSEDARTVAALFGKGNINQGIRVALEKLSGLMPRLPDGEVAARQVWTYYVDDDESLLSKEHAGWRRLVARALDAYTKTAEPTNMARAGEAVATLIMELRDDERRRIRVEARRPKGIIASQARDADEDIRTPLQLGCPHGAWRAGQKQCSKCTAENGLHDTAFDAPAPEPGTTAQPPGQAPDDDDTSWLDEPQTGVIP